MSDTKKQIWGVGTHKIEVTLEAEYILLLMPRLDNIAILYLDIQVIRDRIRTDLILDLDSDVISLYDKLILRISLHWTSHWRAKP